jgi:6-phosphogluconolactonase
MMPVARAQTWTAYVGTYTRRGSEGIYAFRFDADSGKLTPQGLAAKARSPSFLALAAGGRYLYASNELTRTSGGEGPEGLGTVSAFAITPGDYHLQLIDRQSSGGEGPCALTVDSSGRWAYVAHYNSGRLAALPIAADGSLQRAAQVIRQIGSGPQPRQKTAHAHCAVLDSSGRYLYCCDLGSDRVFVYRTGGSPPLTRVASVAVPAGSGPRHLLLNERARRAYVVDELASTLCVFSWDPNTGGLALLQTASTLPAGFTGRSAAAELQLSADGRFLFVSNRGADTLARFTLPQPRNSRPGAVPTGGDGAPPGAGVALSGSFSTEGRTPRFFCFDPTGRYVLVADQDSAVIRVFPYDAAGGTVSGTPSDSAAVIQPACIVFAKD